MIRFLPEKYSNPEILLKKLKSEPANLWVKKGESGALKFFHEAAERVPAYKDFLKKRGIKHKSIKTIKDFRKVPFTDKNNYLRKYSFADLSWDGRFSEKRWVISSTSGSTGEPFYFPRERWQDMQYAGTAELYLRANFNIHKKSTLYINCFALGVWIGGIFTYEAVKLIAEKGKYKLSIINPGLNKNEIFKAVKRLGHEFEQLIIGGYSPFVKDVIDEGEKEGISWKDYDIGFVFSAEAFSEEFRDYIIKKCGIKNPFKGTLNHYGTVDQGTLAHETPLAVMIRKMAVKNKKFFDMVFRNKEGRLPTLAQYDPEMFFFEEVDGGLICTAASGLPLIRYDLKDYGGIIDFDEMVQNFYSAGFDFKRETKKRDIADSVWRLPFVYVFERKDFSVSLAGANIYPETVKRALTSVKIAGKLTGKFSMSVENDKNYNQLLKINIELKKGVKKASKSFRRMTTDIILRRLLKENSEFRSVFHDQKGGRAIPKIVFWPYEYPLYFSGKGKQKWVIK